MYTVMKLQMRCGIDRCKMEASRRAVMELQVRSDSAVQCGLIFWLL